MRSIAILLALAALVGVGPGTTPRLITPNVHARVVPGVTAASPAEQSAQDHTQARLQADLTAVRAFRPAFPFWQHIFTIPDGRIIFGSAEDGRLLTTFPIRGDWARRDTYGRTARGYTAGRFRGHDWVYTELEYRADLTRSDLLGAVAFANASRLSDAEISGSDRWVPAGGAGLRIKLDKDRRSNIAIDVAWGREGSRGLFLAFNEAF